MYYGLAFGGKEKRLTRAEITTWPPAGTKKGFTTEKTEGAEKRKEESSGDSLSVTSVFSLVKYRTYAEGIC